MKKVYFLILFVTTILISSAQTTTKNDPDAKTILDRVSAKFKGFKSAKANFTYKVENSSGKVLSSKNGTVFMKGVKYQVSIVGQEIFCDGQNIWTFDKSANEVTITTFDTEGSTLTPQKLFTNFYDHDFLYKLNGEKKQGTKTIQEIEMTPTDKSRPFHKVYIYIDKAGKTISSTKVLEKSGSRYSYIVNSLAPNSTIADSQFVFDAKKYPGVEVIDLR
ncbi:MAG TPA: outer membrane lipoprotein carrier protein LolA [Chitinophagaceae bacterium]|nr:outer membrane lipoprotein carrier protein LolA [Chitinophagaceae bacterium]